MTKSDRTSTVSTDGLEMWIAPDNKMDKQFENLRLSQAVVELPKMKHYQGRAGRVLGQ